jgi:hypothetical protein
MKTEEQKREEGRAYQCEKKVCDCHEQGLRHCPGCGEIYLYYEKNDKKMCTDCSNEW